MYYIFIIYFKTNWIEKKSNMEVLNMVNEQRKIIKMINIRKPKFFRHILRRNTFITSFMEGKING
jgi:hypothetical protein